MKAKPVLSLGLAIAEDYSFTVIKCLGVHLGSTCWRPDHHRAEAKKDRMPLSPSEDAESQVLWHHQEVRIHWKPSPQPGQ